MKIELSDEDQDAIRLALSCHMFTLEERVKGLDPERNAEHLAKIAEVRAAMDRAFKILVRAKFGIPQPSEVA